MIPPDCALLRMHWEQSPRMLAIVEVDFAANDIMFLKLNAACATVFALKQSEGAGKWFRRDLHQSDTLVDGWIAGHRRCVDAGASHYTYTNGLLEMCEQGPRSVLVTYMCENAATRRPIFSVDVAVEDVTPSVLKNNPSKEMECLQLALAGTSEGIWEWCLETDNVYTSDSYWKLLGYGPQEFSTGQAWKDSLHPDDRERVAGELHDHFEGRTAHYVSEHRCRTKDGGYKWIMNRGRVVARDYHGKPTRMVGAYMDFTHVKETEHALQQSEKQLQDLMRLVPVVICRGGPDGSIRFTNAYWKELVGIDPAQVLGGSSIEFVAPDDRERIEANWRNSVEKKESFTNAFRYAKPSGEQVYCRSKVDWIQDEGAEPYFVGAIWNVTNEKRAEMELEKKNKELEVAMQFKADFLANMSHEIRTPLHGITSIATLLADTALTDEQRDLVNSLLECSLSLVRIVNDILDFSKIEAGKLVLEDKPFSLERCLASVVNLLRLKAQEKGITLASAFDAEIPRKVRGDMERLKQVLMNIIGNAIKFTPQGGRVDVDVKLCDAASDNDELGVLFAITDTGIGISSETRDKLFQPFSQADSSSSRKFGGTGLGLAISRNLVRMMRGDVWFDSELEKGSRFFVSIRVPRAVTEEETRQGEEQTPSAVAPAKVFQEEFAAANPHEILVAEDNAINQKIVLKILRRLGYHPGLVENGRLAVDAVTKKRYDIILMDIQMPVMGGVEATQCIRRTIPKEQQPFVVALTANALEGDRARFLGEGLDEYLAKPLNIDRLKAILAADVGVRARTEGGSCA